MTESVNCVWVGIKGLPPQTDLKHEGEESEGKVAEIVFI